MGYAKHGMVYTGLRTEYARENAYNTFASLQHLAWCMPDDSQQSMYLAALEQS